MIRNDREYAEAVERLRQEQQRLETQRRELQAVGLDERQIERALNPMRSFHLQLAEEVRDYERLQRGQFDPLRNFQGLGRLLVALRISRGLSQRQLAERLGVHETQVSRDERNEYHGITVERASRVLEAMGVELSSRVRDANNPAADVA